MKRFIAATIAVFLVVVSVACSKAAEPVTVPDREGGSGIAVPAPAPPGKAPPPIIMIPPATATAVPRPTPTPVPAPSKGGDSSQSIPNDTDRMIVRTGQMSILVEDITGTLDRITALTTGYKGWVVSSSSWREGERLRGVIAVRVPAIEFDNAMRSIAALAAEVTNLNSSSQDVTQEYTDLNAKLKNLEATEQQLLQIMAKATKVEDILAIQRELTNTRSQIESIKARTLYLERTSQTSLINVNLEQSKVDAKFTASKVSLKVGETVRFSAQITGGIAPFTYEWDFGDGRTGTGTTVTHEYRSPGNYTVSLKITDDRKNSDTEVRKEYVSVLPGWSAGEIASSAWRGLVIFGQVAADIGIWLLVFSPVWLIGGGIGFWLRRRRKKAKAA